MGPKEINCLALTLVLWLSLSGCESSDSQNQRQPSKSDGTAAPQGVAQAPPKLGPDASGTAPAPPGMGPVAPVVGPAPPGVSRPSGESAGVNDVDDSLAADHAAKLAGVIEQVAPCLVRLDIVSANGPVSGSGFVVSEAGTIVTNYHVAEAAQTVSATFGDGSKLAIEGFKYVAPARDVAVLQTAPPERALPFLQLAKKDPIKNDSVVALGSPPGASFSACEGSVSGIRTGKKPGDLAELGAELIGIWAQVSAQVSPETSGGPLVNRAGDVVGMATATLATERNFALSREELRLALDKARTQPVTALDKLPPFRNPSKAPRPAIDAEVTPTENAQPSKTDLSQQESAEFARLSTVVWFGAKCRDIKELPPVAKNSLGRKRTDSGSAVAIQEISDDSPASRAGILKDDLLGTLDGTPVTQAGDIEKLVDQFTEGQDAKVLVWRPQPNGRYSKKLLTVRIEPLIPRRALDYVTTADVPPEVRDLLKRHLLRYAAKLFETINPPEQQKAGSGASAGGKQPPVGSGGMPVQAIREKSPFAPSFAPAFGTDVPVRLGNIGHLEHVRVLAIATQKMAVARIKGGLIALLADTSSLIKGKQLKEETFNLGRAQIIGTVTVMLDEKNARTATIFVARPLAVEAYLPQW